MSGKKSRKNLPTRPAKETVDDKIRRILREELHALGLVGARRVHEEPDSPLEIDRVADSVVERQAYEPVLQSYDLRKRAGMSNALAETMAKLERGIDPTPLDYDLPPGESHFTNAAFKESFVKKLQEAGATTGGAYEATCAEFGVNCHKKLNPMARVLQELPEVAGGAYSLSAGDAAEKFGLDRQLVGGVTDEDGKPLKKGGIFEG